MSTIVTEGSSGWKTSEKIVFRIAFIYFLLQILPLDPKFYVLVFNTDWSSFKDIFQLTAWYPQFWSGDSGSAFSAYTDWGIFLLIAIVGGLVWSYIDREKKDYNYLYYWLRVLLRYRLAIGLIGYGFLKLFPLQIPQPTLSDLNTPYGDFLAWKIYYLTTGAAQSAYEPTLGAFEVVAALLLLFRKTTTFGAAIAAAVLTNVAVANFAYGIGDHVYSAYLLVIALFLLAYDLPRLFSLLSRFQFTRANTFRPLFSAQTLKRRNILKAVFAGLLIFYADRVYTAYQKEGSFPFSGIPGLPGAEGYYLVSEFRAGDSLLPHSLQDTVRWQNVVLEKWNTLSVRKATPPPVNFSPARTVFSERDGAFSYESLGNGGRHFYTYSQDSAQSILRLYNKQVPGDSLTLQYRRPNDSTIVLSGVNATSDSLSLVLTRRDKKYLLLEGRRNPKIRF